MKALILGILLTSLTALSAQAACLQDNETVTLEGVLITKSIRLDPKDFGWVKGDGVQVYRALVVNPPVCLLVDGVATEKGTFIHLGVNAESLKLPQDGTVVRVTGSIFSAHTAHHFENFVMLTDQISTK